MTKEEEKELKKLIPPENWDREAYTYSIRYCPGYEGYIPKNLKHEVCKYCGQIHYYH